MPDWNAVRMFTLGAREEIERFIQSLKEQKDNLTSDLVLHNSLIADRTAGRWERRTLRGGSCSRHDGARKSRRSGLRLVLEVPVEKARCNEALVILYEAVQEAITSVSRCTVADSFSNIDDAGVGLLDH